MACLQMGTAFLTVSKSVLNMEGVRTAPASYHPQQHSCPASPTWTQYLQQESTEHGKSRARFPGDGIEALSFVNITSTFFLLLIFRERERAHSRDRERGRENESQAGSELSAQSPPWGSNSQTVRSRPELK